MAGAVTQSISFFRGSHQLPQRRCVVTLVCYSDANGDCDAILSDIAALLGLYLYSCKTVPGILTEVPSPYLVQVKDLDNVVLFSAADRSSTVVEKERCDNILSQYPMVTENLKLVLSGMGASNKTTVRLEFVE